MLAMDATEAPSPAKRLKVGKVVKKRTLKSSQQKVSPDTMQKLKGRPWLEQTLVISVVSQSQSKFTATAYLKVQENLKLPTEGDVRLEDPASSVATLSSLQNLDKEISFTNQFLAEKSQEDEPEKTNTEAEVQSLVTVPIHQDTSSVPLMTTLVIDLTVSQPVSTTIQASLPTSTAITTTITLPPPSPQPQQGISNSIIIQQIGELERSIADQVDASRLEGKVRQAMKHDPPIRDSRLV
ncbi:hypothetical protein Tco_0488893 [Tanacetum coccineum]